MLIKILLTFAVISLFSLILSLLFEVDDDFLEKVVTVIGTSFIILCIVGTIALGVFFIIMIWS